MANPTVGEMFESARDPLQRALRMIEEAPGYANINSVLGAIVAAEGAMSDAAHRIAAALEMALWVRNGGPT